MKTMVAGAVLVAAVAVSGSTIIGGDIHEVTFDESGSPYIIEQEAVVPSGKALQIDPGAVLMFKPFTGLRIEGEIIAEGTNDKPVVFTSIHDTAYGDPTGQLPNAFDWNGIHLTPSCTKADLDHIIVKYTVYGIKSQTANVHIRNAVFTQNGQFHFTVNNKIQLVQDEIPFSYNVPDASAAVSTTPTAGAGKPESDDWAVVEEDESGRTARIFRYVCLGAGVVGLGAGTFFAIKSADYAEQRDAAPDGTGWKDLDKSAQTASTASAVSFGLGGAFLVGFGVTFFF
ncbi:MAG: hypothetical protein GF331_02030 [Chitinivibrionales bacterium]|nr:hypothetical protein [Chitinivibrionales bacterium]